MAELVPTVSNRRSCGWEEESLEILRHGPILEECLSEFGRIEPPNCRIRVPGSTESHYAPRTPLIIIQALGSHGLKRSDWPSKTGLLLWSGSAEGFEASERLSPTRDFRGRRQSRDEAP
jgi:hypothetical protein